jgi:hypothetical protein
VTERSIWPPAVIFYILSIQSCTNSAIESIDLISAFIHELEESGNLGDPESKSFSSQDVLNAVQNVATQAAAISRHFWPSRPEHEWRGTDLRRRLAIREESALKSRSLRNELEHFDEKLDKYLEGGLVGHIIPQYVGPEPLPSEVPLHIFRSYYYDTGVFQLLGKHYNLLPIVEEIEHLHERLGNPK